MDVAWCGNVLPLFALQQPWVLGFPPSIPAVSPWSRPQHYARSPSTKKGRMDGWTIADAWDLITYGLCHSGPLVKKNAKTRRPGLGSGGGLQRGSLQLFNCDSNEVIHKKKSDWNVNLTSQSSIRLLGFFPLTCVHHVAWLEAWGDAVTLPSADWFWAATCAGSAETGMPAFSMLFMLSFEMYLFTA